MYSYSLHSRNPSETEPFSNIGSSNSTERKHISVRSYEQPDFCVLHCPPELVRKHLLVVDDHHSTREVFQLHLQAGGYHVTIASSAEEALYHLQYQRFDLMLSDLYMPDQTGLELLQITQTHYPNMPVILITGAGDVQAAREAIELGACDFIVKPCFSRELIITIEKNLTRHQKQTAHNKVEVSGKGILDIFLAVLNARDVETQGHSERVTAYTLEMADAMGFSQEEIYDLEWGALLHDIGKIGIPDRILLKPGALTIDEQRFMRKHPLIGYDICMKIEICPPLVQERLRRAADIVRNHHEMWNGNGYPDRLSGTNIPLGARVFAIADTLDAILSTRPYRPAQSFDTAYREILQHSRAQFDPDIVDVFATIPAERWFELRE